MSVPSPCAQPSISASRQRGRRNTMYRSPTSASRAEPIARRGAISSSKPTVEPGASATNDRRPEFQRMMEAGTARPPAFDVVIVHSFSRFFRDHFELEFYVRKLAKNGVKLVSMTQELGDDPMHVMMRQIMALFDEYQSKENANHTLQVLHVDDRVVDHRPDRDREAPQGHGVDADPVEREREHAEQQRDGHGDERDDARPAR